MADRAPSLSRRGLLGGAVAVTAGAASGAVAHGANMAVSEPVFAAIALTVDPIFHLIANHQQLYDASGAAANYGSEAACAAETAALDVLLRTVPDTLGGFLAYVDHVRGPRGVSGMGDDRLAVVFDTIAAFAQREVRHA